MKIEIEKTTAHACKYTVGRENGTQEVILLDTKTYFLHDICHYAVEKHLRYTKGFWGMLSEGYSFNELFGKDNPVTAELRFIEQVVGPVQSVFMGNIPKQELGMYLQHIDFTLDEEILSGCLAEIEKILADWKQLGTGERLALDWNL